MAPKQDAAMTYRDLTIGNIVTEPGSAAAYRTGDWRSQRPVWDKNVCVKCGRCASVCPEPCIVHDAEGYYEADLYWCKGCGLCAYECPKKAITMVEENV
ncbi:MAG: 4Fe-4S binding protein [Desulfobacterota bacterium]|nr:4Fe-4S binding protein [Thermodesulfobacteriota bacterium]